MAAKSTWFKVATAGPTIDGREIETQWLTDIADTYDMDEYTASIFPDHYSWWGNHGQVLEVKTEKDKKKRLCLFARIKPNRLLLNLNEEGQKLFTSIKVEPDFAKTGKAYLSHLAITDTPASLGTSQLEFSKANPEEFSHVFALEEAIELNFDNEQTDEELAEEVAKRPGFFKRFFNDQIPPKQDEKEMRKEDKERFEKLEGDFTGFKKQFDALTNKGDESSDDQTNGFSEQVKILEDQIASLKEENKSFKAMGVKFEKIESDLAEALKDADEVPPKSTGEAESNFEIV